MTDTETPEQRKAWVEAEEQCDICFLQRITQWKKELQE